MTIDTPNYDKLPENFREPVRHYVEDGMSPGDTLYAILTNNLLDTACRLDPKLLSQLRDIVLWFHWEVPALCWGNSAKVRYWIDNGGANGIKTAPKESELYRRLGIS